MQSGQGTETDLPDQRAIVRLLARCACNNHTICDDELRPVGELHLSLNCAALACID